jgi:dipeptidyl aminopeptidase/acylaminoacyl peptidase
VSLRHVEWGTQDRPHTLKAFLSVTDRFFRHYYSDSKEFLPHSLIYDCACESLKNDSLADALIRSGAAAYVGWTESVSLASSTAVVLVIDMADGTNLEHAVATLPESLRHEGDAWLRYYPDPAGGTIQLGGDGRHAFQVYSDNPADDECPWLSPDRSKIAFHSNRDGNWEIYVMNEDGSNQTDLTNNPACDAYPAWSPDGSKIAFTSDRDGNYEIYVMNADGSKQTRLTNNTASDVGPVWSLDGSKIFFGSDRGGNWEIYVMNSDGSNQTVLTGGARGARTTTSMSSTRPEP